MGPGKIAKHAKGESLVKELWEVRVGMEDGRNPTEKVANAAPPEASIFTDGSMLADRGGVGMMNVIGPFDEVAVAALAEPRKQGEFQVIVSIHEAWEQEEAAQIDAAFGVRGAFRRSCVARFQQRDPAIFDCQVSLCALLWAEG